MKAKTKADLLKELKEKEEEISQLENDRGYWIEECDILRDMLNALKSIIKDHLKFYQED